jgi:hypothetical protein
MLQAFENRLDSFHVRPNPEITSFDLAKHPVDSPRQFDRELGGLQR